MANKCNARTRFQRGANNVYDCGVCHRTTRGAGDAFNVRLCGECFELAGIDNTISDNGIEYATENGWVADAQAQLKKLAAHGVDVQRVWASLIEEIGGLR